MGTQGTGRKRIPNRERLSAEDDALNQIAREAEARLAAKRAARAEAREIRMKELERQQKEIYQVQKKYYGLDNKWGDIEQWMEDSERYSRHSRRNTSVSDDEERMSVGSRGSLRSDLNPAGAYAGASVGESSHSHKKSKKKKKKHSRSSNGYEDDYSIMSSRSSRMSDESKASRPSRLDLQLGNYSSSDLYSTNSLPSSRLPSSAQNGSRPALLCSDAPHSRSLRGSLYEDSLHSGTRRFSGSSSRAPSEYSGFLGSNSRASSRASSARASPVVEERSDRDFLEKGSRTASTLSAATLASLGGTSSRRGSGDTSLSVDTEASIREIKEIHELKDQIQDVEAKHLQNLREAKDSLVEVEEKYRKAMVSNAQLDNEKSNLMYQVDTLKDSLMELEEQLSESRREFEEKAKDFEREKHAHSMLQFQFSEVKETLKQSEELLTEIRQLRAKQDGFAREISDLQETVEWKDKKIGALERQKEYSDAIRDERDELRDEVVKLKDVLKKHGIVLGAELTTNGEAGEGVIDGPANADSATRLGQDPQTPHVGGDGMLGKVKEAQLGGRDVEVVDSGVALDKAKSPAVQLQKRQQGQTESLEECDGKMIPDHPSEECVSSQTSHGEIAKRESLEKAQSDSTRSDDEIAPVDSEHNNDIGPNACPHSTAESESRLGCQPEVKVVITGPEEEMTGEEECVGNGTDKGENEVIDERSEDVGERYNSAGSGEGESAAENNLESRSLSEAIVKETSEDGVESESRNADMLQEAGKEGLDNTELVDGSIPQEGMSKDAEESSTLGSLKNDTDIAECQDTYLSQEQESESVVELRDRQGSENILETAAMAGSHVDKLGVMNNGEDEAKCLAAKGPGTVEAPNMEIGPGSFTVDSKEFNGPDLKDEAQSGDLLTTALTQPPTAQQTLQKAEEPTKTPHQDRSSASGKKKKKKKKKGKKGGVQESSSKTSEKAEDGDGEIQENSISAVGELVEQAEVSSEEHLASEKGEKSEPSAVPETLKDDSTTKKENENLPCEGQQANIEETQILATADEVKALEGCPKSPAGAGNANKFEKEDSQLSESASLEETQARNDPEEDKEEQSPQTQEAESVNTGDPKLDNPGDLKAESVLDQEVKGTGESESGHVTMDIVTCVDMGSAQDQILEEIEMGTGTNEGHPQENQSTQEYVLSSPSTETEELAAAPSEAGTTEDIHSGQEVKPLVQEEPAGPLDVLEENQPSVDKSVGQEKDEPEESIATAEEETIVKAPHEGSVESLDTQECVLLSPSTEKEELAAEVGTTEHIDSRKQAESLVQEEPTGPSDFCEENQPSVNNSLGQEREEPQNVAKPEEEAIVKPPHEGSVESQGTQECVLLNPSTEKEELAAEVGTTEDIDSSKEAESLVREEPTGPPDFSEENQPSVNNSLGQEREGPESIKTQEEDAKQDGSVEQGEEPTEEGPDIKEEGNYPVEEHSEVVEGLGTSSRETNCQAFGRESGESAERYLVDGIADQGLSKKEQQDTVVEQEEKADEAEPLPQEEVDRHEEEDENEEGESFDFEEADLSSVEGTLEEEAAGPTSIEGEEEQEDGSKVEIQTGTNQDKNQENVEPHLTKQEDPGCEREEEGMAREQLETAQVDKVQNPGDDVFEERKGMTAVEASAERNATERMGSQETAESVSQSNEQHGRRDSSKSNKKGKGKGKEDCRMS
ncbi:uncharacterized protein lrrfip1a isoform X5 [Conger conger]|uniref:uncharacterized protein lrrfip1a isoform X5 n=1 Tax=Conger conger TaxID=82655 RepID=UPI002A5A2BA5|nr:uncharacterized protein lrrfip1a isoform X5 [Conger conger]